MRNSLRFAFVLVLLAIPTRVLAWNNVGHMVVAEIAWRQLPDNIKAKIGELLKSHPHYKSYLLENKPVGGNDAEWAFLKAATWPDYVRGSRPGDRYYKPASVTRYSRPPWHYIDVPYIAPGFKVPATEAATVPTTEPAVDVLTASILNLKILADASAKADDRAVALAWVEHLTGDLHQPLHAVGWFSPTFPRGDRGGNDEVIKTPTGVVVLHSFWDGALGYADDARTINAVADEIMKDPALAAELAKDADHKDIPSWIAESHDAAVSTAYLDGKLPFAKASDWHANTIAASDVPALPPDYVNNAQALSRIRVGLAGHRLAEQIKEAMGAGSP